MAPEAPHIRVVNIGRQFGRGFQRMDSASPFQKIMTWTLAILVGIPLAIILTLLFVVLFGVMLAFGLISWMLGKPRRSPMQWTMAQPGMNPGPFAQQSQDVESNAPGRENVKVVPRR